MEQDLTKLKELHEIEREAHHAWYKEWTGFPFSFRATHNNNGRPNHILVWLVILGIILIGTTTFFLWPEFQIGGTSYQLQNGIDYQCPGGDWHGNTSQMIMLSGDLARYYYCPMDGRLIGIQKLSDPLWR